MKLLNKKTLLALTLCAVSTASMAGWVCSGCITGDNGVTKCRSCELK